MVLLSISLLTNEAEALALLLAIHLPAFVKSDFVLCSLDRVCCLFSYLFLRNSLCILDIICKL